MQSLRDDGFRGVACLGEEGDCFPPCVSYYFAIFISVFGLHAYFLWKPQADCPQARQAEAVTPAHPATAACCSTPGTLVCHGEGRSSPGWNLKYHITREQLLHMHRRTSMHAHTRAEKKTRHITYIHIYNIYIFKTRHHIVSCYVIIIFQLRKNKPMRWKPRPLSFNIVFATDFPCSSGTVMSFSFRHFPSRKWEWTCLATNKWAFMEIKCNKYS